MKIVNTLLDSCKQLYNSAKERKQDKFTKTNKEEYNIKGKYTNNSQNDKSYDA